MTLSLEKLEKITTAFSAKERSYEKIMRVCCGTGCITSGANRVFENLCEAVGRDGLSTRILVKKTGCHGLCERGPIVMLGTDEVLYQSVGKRDLAGDVELLIKTVTEKSIADKLLFRSAAKKEKYVSPLDIPFYKGQKRIVLARNGFIDPEEIDDYIAHGGYRAPFRALQMDARRDHRLGYQGRPARQGRRRLCHGQKMAFSPSLHTALQNMYLPMEMRVTLVRSWTGR